MTLEIGTKDQQGFLLVEAVWGFLILGLVVVSASWVFTTSHACIMKAQEILEVNQCLEERRIEKYLKLSSLSLACPDSIEWVEESLPVNDHLSSHIVRIHKKAANAFYEQEIEFYLPVL
jgi:hypothetical protein